jgi:hypothetical protein
MFTNAIDAAVEYLRRGWAPIPIPWREKNPGFNGWEKLRVTPETLKKHFNGARQNIGVLLGEPSNRLIDTDIDCREALITADYYLPDTGSRFGRASTPNAHRLFISDCKTKKFVDPMAAPDEGMLIELRSTGAQTVFPNSTHKETGELIEWLCDNGPTEIDGAELTRLGGLVAGSALIARYWPVHARHEASLALAGALRHSGWSLEQTEIFVKAVVEAAGDEEATDRIRAARDTFASKKPTTGWPRLAEMLGEPIIGRLRDWLGVRGEEWPEPGHISQVLLPVPAFDADALLPEPLRGWILDQAEGLPCPAEFIAVPAIVAAGSVIGARCGIRPKVHSHWVSIPNLWGGIVGAPGSKKSPAIYAAFQPLGQLIKDARKIHAEALRDSKSDSQEDGLQNDEEPQVAEKRYKSNDGTVEKLADMLVENPGGLLVQRDELVGLIASWDMKGHEQSRAFYLESWNGYSDYSVDRIKRGSSYLPNLCLSVFGGIQPAKLAAYLNQAQDALADDGMLQRFQMLVYPDPRRWENVDRAPNTASLVIPFVTSLRENRCSMSKKGTVPLSWTMTPSPGTPVRRLMRWPNISLSLLLPSAKYEHVKLWPKALKNVQPGNPTAFVVFAGSVMSPAVALAIVRAIALSAARCPACPPGRQIHSVPVASSMSTVRYSHRLGLMVEYCPRRSSSPTTLKNLFQKLLVRS